MRNGRFLADLMDRAWSFRQEMRRSKPRDIHDGHQSSALRPAVVSGSAHSGGGAFALSWVALISSWGLKASGRPRASSRWDCGRKRLFQPDGVLTIWANSARQKAFALFAGDAPALTAYAPTMVRQRRKQVWSTQVEIFGRRR